MTNECPYTSAQALLRPSESAASLKWFRSPDYSISFEAWSHGMGHTSLPGGPQVPDQALRPLAGGLVPELRQFCVSVLCSSVPQANAGVAGAGV